MVAHGSYKAIAHVQLMVRLPIIFTNAGVSDWSGVGLQNQSSEFDSRLSLPFSKIFISSLNYILNDKL